MNQIYSYSKTTKEYTPTAKPVYAKEDPLDPDNIPVPAHATLVEPPNYNVNSIPVWNGSAWEVKADYRGTTYLDLDENVVTITEIGVRVPDFASQEYLQGVRLAAFTAKATELVTMKSMRNNKYPFIYDGHEYVNDEVNLIGVRVASMGKDLTQPIQTFIGTENEGKWKTNDRNYISFTYQEFINGLSEAYFLMRTTNFTNTDVKYAELMAIYMDPTKTVEDIDAFDLTTGWSTATVLPE